MQQLFSIQNKKLLMPVVKKEEILRDCLWDNRKEVFQNHNFIFIDKEFSLKGQVHDLGNSGRIDILAYNKDTNRFIIFELKRDDGKYKGLYQATRYRNYIKYHFADVYLDATKKCKESLPHHDEVDKKKVEIIHIAKDFTQSIINEAKEEDSLITLIRYNWFSDDLLFLDCVHDGTLPAKPDTIGGGGPKKHSKYSEMSWEELIAACPHPTSQKTFKAFPPTTKENIDELRQFVTQRYSKKSKDRFKAFQKWLDEFEKQLEEQK